MIACALALGWILLPFYGPILWGTVIALIFAPLNRRLLPRTGHDPNPAMAAAQLEILKTKVLPRIGKGG